MKKTVLFDKLEEIKTEENQTESVQVAPDSLLRAAPPCQFPSRKNSHAN